MNSYDKALTELEQIISELEEDVISIDNLSVKMKRAAELLHFCKEKLRDTEKTINDIFEDNP